MRNGFRSAAALLALGASIGCGTSNETATTSTITAAACPEGGFNFERTKVCRDGVMRAYQPRPTAAERRAAREREVDRREAARRRRERARRTQERRERQADAAKRAAQARYAKLDDLAIRLDSAIGIAIDTSSSGARADTSALQSLDDAIHDEINDALLAGNDMSVGANLLGSASADAVLYAGDGDVQGLIRQRRTITEARARLADEAISP